MGIGVLGGALVVIGRIYGEEDIEKIKEPIAVIERTLNNN